MRRARPRCHPLACAQALFRDEYKLSPPLYRIKQQQVARAAADEQAEAVAESATLSSSSSALSSVSDDDADSKGADSVLRDLDVDELAQRTAPGAPLAACALPIPPSWRCACSDGGGTQEARAGGRGRRAQGARGRC